MITLICVWVIIIASYIGFLAENITLGEYVMIILLALIFQQLVYLNN